MNNQNGSNLNQSGDILESDEDILGFDDVDEVAEEFAGAGNLNFGPDFNHKEKPSEENIEDESVDMTPGQAIRSKNGLSSTYQKQKTLPISTKNGINSN